jgi:ATP-binding cassette subfamily C (CFTR/MRP) protein 1
VVSFGTYMLLGYELTARKVFVTVSMYNILRFPLTMLPLGVKFTNESKVAVQRLKAYLMSPECIYGMHHSKCDFVLIVL